MFGKGWLALVVLSFSTLASATVRIQNAFASNASGNAIQTQLGESFFITLDLQSDQASEPFTVAFTAASGNRQSSTFSTSGGVGHLTWGPFANLMAGPMTITARVLEGGATSSISVSPSLPATALEKYAPTSNHGTLSATWSGSLKGTTWWIPVVPNGPFQDISSLIEPGMPSVASSTGQMVSVLPGSSSVESDVQFTGWSVRTNPSILRQTTFSALDLGAKPMKSWLASETYVEVGNSTIDSFVSTALGKSYRTKLTPYDAAQALYLATIRKLRYVPTAFAPDAVKALKRGTGDCGSFSSLFVAACRTAGIPARAACGFTAGVDQWHVWAEFWLPNTGWIPVDPTYAAALRPQGDMPLYFGVMPDLNRRVVTAYGFDRAIGRVKASMLQSPALFLPNSKTAGSLIAHCNL